MRDWILFILYINRKLDKLSAFIEKKVESISLDMQKRADKAVLEIRALNEQKARLINLRVLHDAIKERLSNDEIALLNSSAPAPLGLRRMTLFRSRDRIFKEAEDELILHGYTADRMEREYAGFAGKPSPTRLRLHASGGKTART